MVVDDDDKNTESARTGNSATASISATNHNNSNEMPPLIGTSPLSGISASAKNDTTRTIIMPSSNNKRKSSPSKKTLTYIPSKLGRRGDPRMHRAVKARLENPQQSLLDALIAGGFEFTWKDGIAYDKDKKQLGQRKNQLSRRLRLHKHNQKENDSILDKKLKEEYTDKKLSLNYSTTTSTSGGISNRNPPGISESSKRQRGQSSSQQQSQPQTLPYIENQFSSQLALLTAQQQQQQPNFNNPIFLQAIPPQNLLNPNSSATIESMVQQQINPNSNVAAAISMEQQIKHVLQLQQTQNQKLTNNNNMTNITSMSNLMNNKNDNNGDINTNNNVINNSNNIKNHDANIYFNPAFQSEIKVAAPTSSTLMSATDTTTNKKYNNNNDMSNPLTSNYPAAVQDKGDKLKKLQHALDIYRLESSSLIKRCMITAGFTYDETDECDEMYLLFSEFALENERKRIDRMRLRMNKNPMAFYNNGNHVHHRSTGGGDGNSSCSSGLNSVVEKMNEINQKQTLFGSINPDQLFDLQKQSNPVSSFLHADLGTVQEKAQEHSHDHNHQHSNHDDTGGGGGDDERKVSLCNNQHIHRLEGKCGHKAIIHKPADGNAHIDFVVDGKIECYAQCQPKMVDSDACWLSKRKCEKDHGTCDGITALVSSFFCETLDIIQFIYSNAQNMKMNNFFFKLSMMVNKKMKLIVYKSVLKKLQEFLDLMRSIVMNGKVSWTVILIQM